MGRGGGEGGGVWGGGSFKSELPSRGKEEVTKVTFPPGTGRKDECETYSGSNTLRAVGPAICLNFVFYFRVFTFQFHF